MAKYTSTIVADGSTLLCTIDRNRNLPSFMATVCAYGTFGSGTLILQISPDGGTTKLTIKDNNSVAISLTASGTANIELLTGSKNTDGLQLYATLTGSTNPSITVATFSNVG